MDLSKFHKSEQQFIQNTEKRTNSVFVGCTESDYEFMFKDIVTSEIRTEISPRYYYELDFFSDGLGDVGDDDLADNVNREIKEAMLKDNDLIYDDFETEIEKCPVCGVWNTWTVFVKNCSWEVWAKCTSHGCGHVWCVVTE